MASCSSLTALSFGEEVRMLPKLSPSSEQSRLSLSRDHKIKIAMMKLFLLSIAVLVVAATACPFAKLAPSNEDMTRAKSMPGPAHKGESFGHMSRMLNQHLSNGEGT